MSIDAIIRDLETLKHIGCVRRAKLAIRTIEQQQAELKQLREGQEWVSVDDRLPVDGEFVILYDAKTKYFNVGWYDKRLDTYAYNYNAHRQAPTHWKHPSPPQDKEG